ncbi:fumarate hydratase subunit beta [Desulfitispora alkaliphila]|uniref:Fe-S-containing hydro-lyase n=1 Tax=Desulfitispora alkaliphila TaxID=622674 RepID=UPI003D2350D0
MAEHKLTTPLTQEDISKLKSGDQVYISGVIYTARDAAHKRLVELIDNGEDLPVELEGQIIYYVGPTPAKPHQVIGSAGPTTSYRMDSLTEPLLKKGLKGMIGKGKRSQEVKDSLQEYGAVYFGAIGGAAALLAKCIVKAEVIAYEDLGPEAIRRLEVKDFPAVVVNDSFGCDLYEEARKSRA